MTVQVGSTTDAPGGIFQFIPPSINAVNGTIVNFQFSGMYALPIWFLQRPIVLTGFIGLETTRLLNRHSTTHVLLSMVDLILVGSFSPLRACPLCLNGTSQSRMTPDVSSCFFLILACINGLMASLSSYLVLL